jgi:spore maturation protein CgeB
LQLVQRAGAAVKNAIRANSATYEIVRRRRARRQEQDYLERRDAYARQAPLVFSPPGYQARSKERLLSGWAGPASVKDIPAEARIFCVVADDPGGPQLHAPLQRSFDCVTFDLARYRNLESMDWKQSLEWRERLQRDLVEAFRDAHRAAPVDLVFAYASYRELEPATLRTLRASGVPVAVYCLDDKHLFARQPDLGFPNGQAPLIGAADLHVTNSLECVRWYLAEGAAAYYMPQGIDPDQYNPVAGDRYMRASFVGQRYGFRGRFIDGLRAAGIEVECFGPGWGQLLTHAEKVDVYSRSIVNLGIAGVGYSDRITCVKGRDFEVPVTGGMYLTTYDHELSELFEIGRELGCYRNAIDCAEQIRYYIENPEEAIKIGAAGRARCLRDHTWEVRMTGLLRWLGVLNPRAA